MANIIMSKPWSLPLGACNKIRGSCKERQVCQCTNNHATDGMGGDQAECHCSVEKGWNVFISKLNLKQKSQDNRLQI